MPARIVNRKRLGAEGDVGATAGSMSVRRFDAVVDWNPSREAYVDRRLAKRSCRAKRSA